jgi:hypothetical protein
LDITPKMGGYPDLFNHLLAMNKLLLILSLFVTSLVTAKPMTAYVESWEGRFTRVSDPISIRAEGRPTLLLWLYQLDRGSKGTVVGFSTEAGDMIVAPKPNEKGVQPIYTGHYVVFGEKDVVEVVVAYDIQGNGAQKRVEKYTYTKESLRLVSVSWYTGKREWMWKRDSD